MPTDIPAAAASHISAVDDERFMALALALGRRGLGRVWPNPAVGAVLVQHRNELATVVGRGWTQPGGRPHAETEALARAGAVARGATLYVTLEPCSHHGRTPPCVDAIIAAGIARVVSAIEDPNPQVSGQGHARLRACGITVDIGIGAAQARRDHAGHICRMRFGRPNVMLKLAVSADGKVALAGRRPAAITDIRSRERVHLMRAQSDAIMVGIDTVLADDPLLTCRLPGMAPRSPTRIILDTRLRLPSTSAIARTAREVPTIVVTAADAGPAPGLEALGVTILRVAAADGRLVLDAALKQLADRGVTRLMVEGGPKVAAAFVAADLVDEVALFRAPKVIGADGVDALEGLPLSALTQSPRLRSHAIEPLGEDSLEYFERA